LGTYTPSTSTCSTTCKCLDLGAITVFPDDGVAPCGQSGVVSFTDCFDFCPCDNEVATMSVQDITPEDVITVNSISQSGLTYTTSDDAEPNQKVTITVKAVCASKTTAGVTLGDYTTITIYIKDLCKGVLCDSGETCNKCTGECEPDVNLTVS